MSEQCNPDAKKMSSPELDELACLSNRYGRDAKFVLAGGGNSSWKNSAVMYIKSSGSSLATIKASEFVCMDRTRLRALMQKRYAQGDDSKREAEVLADMMDSRMPGSETLRPSVETLLHDLFPYAYVLHLHPSLVNGMTCGVNGERAAHEIFGNSFVWVPEYKPGYELAKLCARLLGDYTKTHGSAPKILFLQNHGVFAAADGVDEIDSIYENIMMRLNARAIVKPSDEMTTVRITSDSYSYASESAAPIRAAFVGSVLSLPDPPAALIRVAGDDIDSLLDSRENFKPLDGAFTPDHIVYCGQKFLYLDDVIEPNDPAGQSGPGDREDSIGLNAPAGPDALAQPPTLADALAAYVAGYGRRPRIICVRGDGAYICADTAKEAENALSLFIDAVKTAVYSANFGGPRHMSQQLTDFIVNWEIESYRQKIAKM